MDTLEIFLQTSQSLTREADTIELNKKTSYEYFISTSYYLRDAYQNTLKEYFESLKYLWLEETKYSSNVYLTTNHPAHLNIIKLGSQILPLLFEELLNNNNHWFIALNRITGENPILNTHKGNVELMKNDWLNWAYENNII